MNKQNSFSRTQANRGRVENGVGAHSPPEEESRQRDGSRHEPLTLLPARGDDASWGQQDGLGVAKERFVRAESRPALVAPAQLRTSNAGMSRGNAALVDGDWLKTSMSDGGEDRSKISIIPSVPFPLDSILGGALIVSRQPKRRLQMIQAAFRRCTTKSTPRCGTTTS